MNNDLKKRIINMVRTLYFLSFITIMLSCNGQKKMAAQKDAQEDGRLTLVAQDNYSGADSTETMVITNAKALKSFYARVNRTRKPGLPVPNIDFSRDMVVVLCSADKVSNMEYGLSVIQETETEIVIGSPEGSNNEQNTTSSNSTSLVSPFFVYKIPLTDKRVSFTPVQ
ncbi:MAG: hypothetical protein ACR2MT_07235 [Aurantibacter sp.]